MNFDEFFRLSKNLEFGYYCSKLVGTPGRSVERLGCTNVNGLSDFSLMIAAIANAGGKTSASGIEYPFSYSISTRLALVLWVSFVTNLTGIPAADNFFTASMDPGIAFEPPVVLSTSTPVISSRTPKIK